MFTNRLPTRPRNRPDPGPRPPTWARALCALPGLGLGWCDGVGAQSTPGPADANVLQEVVISTGSRGHQLTIADSPSPIDVFSGDQIRATGKASLREILGALAPSFTAAAQPGGGTSASVRPAKIRGLSGDELLVLVNGKRRHNTAIYNNFGTGSTPVDLDLIPVASIERIELLRDGAAAQYGSDAIAGVLNIILKRADQGGSATTTVGQQQDKPGDLFQQSFNLGHAIGEEGGFINIGVDARLQGPSYSAGEAQGSLYYPLLNGKPVAFGTPGATPDPREATAEREIAHGVGRSNRDKVYSSAYNAELPLSESLTLYSFGTLSHRNVVDTRGNFRATNVSSLPEVYPDGFAAQRKIGELDYQVLIGGKGLVQGWGWDASSSYSRDNAKLGARNTLNPSLGPTSPTVFYLGGLRAEQLTTNVDVTRDVALGLSKPAQLAFGFEHRWERYTELAGDPDSYINGGYVIPSGPRAGQRPPAGLVSFTGNSASDAGAKHRNNLATYLDLGANITPTWYGDAALRFEHYDDSSGNTVSGKLSSRYEIAKGWAIRGTVNNGFRAPSLGQQIFSVTQNTSVTTGGVIQSVQAAYLPPGSAAAQALGAQPLKPEKSQNISVGLTFEPSKRLRATIDAYQIKIKDLIVKSEILQDPVTSTTRPIQTLLSSLGFTSLYSAQYNVNAADTTTRGVDIAIEDAEDYKAFGSVRWTAVYGYNKTSIGSLAGNPSALDFLGSSYVLVGRQAQLLLTDASPRDRIVLGGDWRIGRFATNLHLTRYGKYTEPGTTAAQDQFFSPKWITDLDVAYRATKQITVALGATNLFGIRPDLQKPVPTATGLGTANPTQVDNPNNRGMFSPFGLNGAFYYARLTYEF